MHLCKCGYLIKNLFFASAADPSGRNFGAISNLPQPTLRVPHWTSRLAASSANLAHFDRMALQIPVPSSLEQVNKIWRFHKMLLDVLLDVQSETEGMFRKLLEKYRKPSEHTLGRLPSSEHIGRRKGSC